MKLRWAINRARVKIAKAIWPPLDPLPPLFEAAEDGVQIDATTLYDADGNVLGCSTENVRLRRGDQWTIRHRITVTTRSGEEVTVNGVFVPATMTPVMLYLGTRCRVVSAASSKPSSG